MSFFQLILKQMRQRALSTWLTLLSVLLGVGLAVAIMLFHREGKALFGQKDFGYDMLIGPKASRLELVLSTVYDIHTSDMGIGLINYDVYDKLANAKPPQVRWALPYVVGDLYEEFRVIGTLPHMFPADWEGKKLEQRTFEYRKDKPLEFAQGRAFHPKKFEAVIGSEVARQTGLKLGSKFSPQHDAGHGQGDHHHEEFTVVGILKRTHTAHDRGLYIPLITYYAIPEHDKGLRDQAKLLRAAMGLPPESATRPVTLPTGELLAPVAPAAKKVSYRENADGTIDIDLPQKDWRITGIFVQNYGGFPQMLLTYQINNLPDAMAVNPAMIMVEFTDKFLSNSTQILLVIAFLVVVVAAISILVSIYNSVANRRREIAVLRALGATQARIVTLICAEAALIGTLGGIGGIVVGHLLGAIGSVYLRDRVGQGINWVAVSGWELLYLLVVVGLSALAGLVPAMKAYKTDVATNLVSA
jgi:putative ABC transport system permease protein